MQGMNLAVVILAAGKGTRMKSDLAKVLHPVNSRPMLAHVLDSVESLMPNRILVVVGYQADEVKRRFKGGTLEFVDQTEQLGTGHAVQQVEPALKDFEGLVLVLCGDMPLIKSATLKNLVEKHIETGVEASLLSLKLPEPRDFGRIVRDSQGKVTRIVEYRDASPAEKTIDEYNSGVYCFNKISLFKALGSIHPDNTQGEYYLTDAIRFFTENGYPVDCAQTTDATEILGINSLKDLEQAEQIFRSRE